MIIFALLEVIDHGSDFWNTFYIPHFNFFGVPIAFSFLCPIFYGIHQLLAVKTISEAKQTLKKYIGLYPEAKNDENAILELYNKILLRKSLLAIFENGIQFSCTILDIFLMG